MYGLGKFEKYLMGRHTLVETDHLLLEKIFKNNVAKMPVADALSRVYIPPKSSTQPEKHSQLHQWN